MLGDHDKGRRFLIVRARGWMCALPLEEVVETMRLLPVTPVAGVSAFVRGVAVVRGESTPVIELAALLGGGGDDMSRRFVSLRVPGRQLVVAVEEVLGLRWLDADALGAVPPLLEKAAGEHVEALGTLDGHVLSVLRAARVLPEDAWARVAGAA